MEHAVILAGGAGTRLWPLARSDRPKHLLRIFDGKSLLRHAFDRLEGLFSPAQTHVITHARDAAAARAELPELPAGNVIPEPATRDTANAIGLAAVRLAAQDEAATMAVFSADHLITPQAAFQRAIRAGMDFAESEPAGLGVFGVPCRTAHTGYGYIECGASLAADVFRVERFHEKPDEAGARRYLEAGRYLWNSGIFVWKVRALLEEFERHLPENLRSLRNLAQSDNLTSAAAAQRYGELRRISIDHGVLEPARTRFVVPLPCEWRDVGAYAALFAEVAGDAGENAALNAELHTADARGNLVVNAADPHVVALLGVSDLVVVRTADVTLICRREDAERVKAFAERAPARLR